MSANTHPHTGRSIGYGLTATPLPRSLSMPRTDLGGRTMDPAAADACGRFFRIRRDDRVAPAPAPDLLAALALHADAGAARA